MNSARPATISEMVSTFDTVTPGYAWAWHDANAHKFQRRFGRPDTFGWRDRRRSRLMYQRDRCLLLYLMNPEEEGVVLLNRGYLEIVRVKFANTSRAVEELMGFATERCRRRWREGHGSWFYGDACEFAERTAITLQILHYVHRNAFCIEPLWQSGDLTRSS